MEFGAELDGRLPGGCGSRRQAAEASLHPRQPRLVLRHGARRGEVPRAGGLARPHVHVQSPLQVAGPLHDLQVCRALPGALHEQRVRKVQSGRREDGGRGKIGRRPLEGWRLALLLPRRPDEQRARQDSALPLRRHEEGLGIRRRPGDAGLPRQHGRLAAESSSRRLPRQSALQPEDCRHGRCQGLRRDGAERGEPRGEGHARPRNPGQACPGVDAGAVRCLG
mmetsp:Transcript_148824/g.386984  ORF Transcript_148824/g.386984 Transcript_148824/m.386984 type:complete len:223 (-) Transcript_148824:166-834(-)